VCQRLYICVKGYTFVSKVIHLHASFANVLCSRLYVAVRLHIRLDVVDQRAAQFFKGRTLIGFVDPATFHQIVP
jgi:hypothetical protein